jgi:putative FmdB family regulatory protein
MPTYEYECASCARVFEVRQRISEPPLTVCEACGGSVRRLLSPAAFILKGGGWYTTDYPSEARKKAMKAESGSSGSSSETKSSTPDPPPAPPAPPSGGDSGPKSKPGAKPGAP